MSGIVPTTENVRAVYVNEPGDEGGTGQQFDWWLADERAKVLRVAAASLYADETAARGTTKAMNHAIYAGWLLDRADRIQAGDPA